MMCAFLPVLHECQDLLQQSLHLVSYYKQHIVHHSVMLMTSQTAHIFYMKPDAQLQHIFSQTAHSHGWSNPVFPNLLSIVHIPRNSHIWKGYRLQKVNHIDCTSITAKIISRKCTYKELLNKSAFLVRKKWKHFSYTALSHVIFFFKYQTTT